MEISKKPNSVTLQIQQDKPYKKLAQYKQTSEPLPSNKTKLNKTKSKKKIKKQNNKKVKIKNKFINKKNNDNNK